MASIFDKVTQGGYGAVKKIKDAAESSRIRGCIEEEENKINKLYHMIGKHYYEEHCNMSEDIVEPYCAWFTEVSQSVLKIKQYEDEIRTIQCVLNCPKCGKTASYESMFCGACGASLAEAKATAKATRHCPHCGEEILDDGVFCSMCGQKL